MSKRILVTGGAGFIGSHTIDALLAEGHQVRVLDNLAPQVHPNGYPTYLASDIEFLRGDMRDLDVVRQAVQDIDVIYHLAAVVGVGQSMYEISHYMGSNTQGTANLLQALLDTKAPVEKLIVASSMSILGEGKYLCASCGEMAPPVRTPEQLKAKDWEVRCPQCGAELAPLAADESKPLQCPSIYALSKKDQEEMCLLYGRIYGLPVVALRYWNIYGTRQALSNPYTGVCAIFASRLLNRRAPLLFEDGKQMRDFVSIRDIVDANLLAMKRSEADGLALNIGSGHSVSVREVAQTLIRSLGLEGEIEPEVTGHYRAGDIRHCFPDISLARRVLGYAPKYNLEQGFPELVEWLREQTAEDRTAEAKQQLAAYGLTA